MWSIWGERNRQFHERKQKPPTAVVSWAANYLDKFHNAVQRPTQLQQSRLDLQSPKLWTRPIMNKFKMNVDASISPSTGTIGIGAIIRNDKGEVMAALAKKIHGTLNSKEAEAKALCLSLQWARDVAVPLYSVESDALSVVQHVSTMKEMRSEFGDLIHDISHLLSFFPGAILNHVYRTANKAAHELAKYALGVDDEFIWLEEVPPSIMFVVVSDVSN